MASNPNEQVARVYRGLTTKEGGNLDWNGTVRFVRERISWPERWVRPRHIFVSSHGDLFHPAMAYRDIKAVFGEMASCPQHTFIVLTKRALKLLDVTNRLLADAHLDQLPENIIPAITAENQEQWVLRVRCLRSVRAARWAVNLEPLLGPIDMGEWGKGLSWVIAGCESGPKRRTAHLEWFRSLRDQCRANDVPFYLKQMEGHVYSDDGDDLEIGFRVVKTPKLDGQQYLMLPGDHWGQ